MTDPIQQQLIAARRNQILDAAGVVFAEKGFHPATIRDIALQAGIADGTIYNYFANKTALLLAIFERMKETILQASPPGPQTGDLRSLITTMLSHPLGALEDGNFALFRIVVSEMMVDEELRALYYAQILAPTIALARGQFQGWAAELGVSLEDMDLLVSVLSSTVLGLMLGTIMGDPTLLEQRAELPEFIADIILSGIGSIS